MKIWGSTEHGIENTMAVNNINDVCVLMPTFNGISRGFIFDAINSALSLSYPIVVIDDGSTDGTGDKIKEKYGGAIEIISKENGGQPSALNVGIKYIRGKYKYLIILCDDDILLSREKQIEYMNFHDNCMMIHGDTEFIFFNGAEMQGYAHNQYWKEILPDYNFINSSTTMIRLSVFDAVGMYDESFLSVEDYYMWLQIHAHFPAGINYIPGVVSKYRMHVLQKSRINNKGDVYEKYIKTAQDRYRITLSLIGAHK